MRDSAQKMCNPRVDNEVGAVVSGVKSMATCWKPGMSKYGANSVRFALVGT